VTAGAGWLVSVTGIGTKTWWLLAVETGTGTGTWCLLALAGGLDRYRHWVSVDLVNLAWADLSSVKFGWDKGGTGRRKLVVFTISEKDVGTLHEWS